MTKRIITEKEFIEFAYHKAHFSNTILKSFDEAISNIQLKGQFIASSEFLNDQKIMLDSIKGSSEIWAPNNYAGKAWIDIVAEEGYLKSDIVDLFHKMTNELVHEPLVKIDINTGFNVGKVTLFRIHNKFYIRDGHKRIALARYLSFIYNQPAYIVGADVINCKLMNIPHMKLVPQAMQFHYA